MCCKTWQNESWFQFSKRVLLHQHIHLLSGTFIDVCIIIIKLRQSFQQAPWSVPIKLTSFKFLTHKLTSCSLSLTAWYRRNTAFSIISFFVIAPVNDYSHLHNIIFFLWIFFSHYQTSFFEVRTECTKSLLVCDVRNTFTFCEKY